MGISDDIEQENARSSFSSILKRLWSTFLIWNSFAFTASILFINVLLVSEIIWPGESFHATEIGLLIGTASFTMAASGLLFGYLADRYSRNKLMAIAQLILGISFFSNGFVPAGLGDITFLYFLIFNLMRGFAVGGFWPLITSYINDGTEEKERSQYFGALQALFQVFQVVGMFISAIVFQNLFWKEYFIIIGIIYILFGIMIGLKAREPKRAATREELREILVDQDIKYDYKLTKQTVKSTILKPTNIIAFVEGLFTTIILAVPDFLVVPYLQSPPLNLSPLSTSFYMIVFGLPGGVIGALAFAKLSDRLAKKNIKYRIYLIVISIITLFICFLILFHFPFPPLTPEQGNNILFILSLPIFWIGGAIAFIARAFVGLWNINQPPILQEINLPEAQGTINSANQFLEYIGHGIGPIIAGSVLAFFNGNYQITSIVILTIGICGAILWLLATLYINKDRDRISIILKERGIELNNKINQSKD